MVLIIAPQPSWSSNDLRHRSRPTTPATNDPCASLKWPGLRVQRPATHHPKDLRRT